MPSPKGIITIDTSYQRAFECEVESCDLAMEPIASEELANIKKDLTNEAPDAKKFAGSFGPTENTK